MTKPRHFVANAEARPQTEEERIYRLDLTEGKPRPTAQRTARELWARGIVGLYRVGQEMAQ